MRIGTQHQTLKLSEEPLRIMESQTEAQQTLVESRASIRSPQDSGGNSLRPFCTAQKPSCGFRFSQDTDHRRRHNDLRACDRNQWRSVMKPQ